MFTIRKKSKSMRKVNLNYMYILAEKKPNLDVQSKCEMMK